MHWSQYGVEQYGTTSNAAARESNYYAVLARCSTIVWTGTKACLLATTEASVDGWHGEQEQPEREQRVAKLRMIAGQALVVTIIAGTLGYRMMQPDPARPPSGATAVTGAQNGTTNPALSVGTRVDVEVPSDVSNVGRRFLMSLSRGDMAVASGDVATISNLLDTQSKLTNAASPFQSAKTRNFRVQYWQPSTDGKEGRLVVGFDYDRPDGAEGRSRVTLRVVAQGDRWVIADIDIALWMSDLGVAFNR